VISTKELGSDFFSRSPQMPRFVGAKPESLGGADDDALPLLDAHNLNLVSDIDFLELHP
jgi:hypothetical protein